MDSLFPISSEQCEILVYLQELGSVAKVSKTLGKDVSTINRQLKALAISHYVVEKIQGGWSLSDHGRAIANLSRDFATEQRKALGQIAELRIVTTREFAARVLSSELKAILPQEMKTRLALYTSENGSEEMLLNGSADIGIDCEMPQDPGIKSKAVLEESFAIVVAPGIANENKINLLAKLPHLHYTRSQTAMARPKGIEPENIAAKFNDLASIRSAAIAGVGWAVLPRYSVRAELESGVLCEIFREHAPKSAQFRISYLRERKQLAHYVDKISDWLKSRNLN